MFSPAGDHTTTFAGTLPQTISVDTGVVSFARAFVANRLALVFFNGQMVFTSDTLPFVLGPSSKVEMSNGRVDVVAGLVNVDVGASLTLFDDFFLASPGLLRLFDNATFTVQGRFFGGCVRTFGGRTSVGVTINGGGTINELPASQDRCTD